MFVVNLFWGSLPARVVALSGLLLALVPSLGRASSIPIDNFSPTDPGYFFSTKGPPNWEAVPSKLAQPSGGSVLGGQRDVWMGVVTGTAQSNSFGSVLQGGVFDVGTASDAGTATILQYDGIDSEPTSAEPAPRPNNAKNLVADLTSGGNNGFRLSFNSIDPGAPGASLNYSIIVNGDPALTKSGAISPSVTFPYAYDVLFSDFTPSWSSVFSNVSSLEFQFNQTGARNVDFELTGIQAVNVPEPGTIAILVTGLGAALLGCWFRSRGR